MLTSAKELTTLCNIKTPSEVTEKNSSSLKLQMRKIGLEIEKSQRSSERERLNARLNKIDHRLAQIEREKAILEQKIALEENAGKSKSMATAKKAGGEKFSFKY